MKNKLFLLISLILLSCNNSTKIVECRVKENKDSISYLYALPLTKDICYIYKSPTKLISFYNIEWMSSTVNNNSIKELENIIMLDTTAYQILNKDLGPLFKDIVEDTKKNY